MTDFSNNTNIPATFGLDRCEALDGKSHPVSLVEMGSE